MNVQRTLDKARFYIAYGLEELAFKIRPPHRYCWLQGDPIPHDAKWLACGHPSTDGSEELISIIHEATDQRRENGWCWWGHGWQDTTAGRLRLVAGGSDGESA